MIDPLIKGCRNLDRGAQRKMVNLLSPLLFVISRRYTSDNETAKDILQESLIQILNNIEQCKAKELNEFKAWSKRITINIALAKKRKNKIPTQELDLKQHTPSIHPSVESSLNVDDILELLMHLPHQQRTVFNLFVVDGYGHKEIAELLKIPESSSRTFLVRARRKLQQIINKQQVNSHEK